MSTQLDNQFSFQISHYSLLSEISSLNNIKYFDKNTKANADEISFNLLNGDVNIKMFDKKKKIQISKN